MVGEASTGIGAASASGAARRTSGRILAQRVIQKISTTAQPRAQTPSRIRAGSSGTPAAGAIAVCARGEAAPAMKTASGAASAGGGISGANSLPRAASPANGTRNFTEAVNHRP